MLREWEAWGFNANSDFPLDVGRFTELLCTSLSTPTKQDYSCYLRALLERKAIFTMILGAEEQDLAYVKSLANED